MDCFTSTHFKSALVFIVICNPATAILLYGVLYLHHEDHSVERDHDEHCVLKGGRCHKVPQFVLEGLPVLGHVAGHRLSADGKVNASPLMERHFNKPDIES